MKVVISLLAKADMYEIRRYIARDNPVAAKRELLRIKEAVQLLASGNVDGRKVCLEDGSIVHVWLVSSYRLYYRRVPGALQVIRVYHHARRPIEQ